MAGHSKWANIKHKKKKQDEKRGAVFTRLIRELTVAAREGGDDLTANSRLRLAVEKAQQGNMPKDKIQSAIDRGAGNIEGLVLEAIRYEGYGPSGVAFIVDCLTDNRNRTVAEVRHAFSKAGGNLGTDGSVSYLFEHRGVILVAPDADEGQVMDVALEAGALDIHTREEGHEVLMERSAFDAVREALEAATLTIVSAEITWLPSNAVAVNDDEAAKVLTLQDKLDQLDDVQSVVHNGEISDDAMNDWLG